MAVRLGRQSVTTFLVQGALGTHEGYDATPHPWEFKRVWRLEPSLSNPDMVYAGVEDAALFRSSDGGHTWQELSGLRGHGSGPGWQPSGDGLCLHTVLLSPRAPNRIFVAISVAGVFRTDDAGKTWRPINRGLKSQYIPDPLAEWATAFITSQRTLGQGRCSWRSIGMSCAATTPANRGMRSVGICRPTSGLPSQFMHTSRTPFTSSRSRVTPNTFRRREDCACTAAARVETSGRHSPGFAAASLLRECAARRHGRRLARFMRRGPWHDRRPGVRFCGRRRQLGDDCSGSSRGSVSRSPDIAMIRIELPQQLRTLAQVDGEVKIQSR